MAINVNSNLLSNVSSNLLRGAAMGILYIGLSISSVSAADRSMLNAWELGSIDQIDAWSNSMLKDLKRFENAWRVTLNHRKSGAGHDHFSSTKDAVCRLSFRLINTRRNMLASWVGKTPYKVSVPNSIEPLLVAIREAYNLADNYQSRQINCEALSLNEYQEFVVATRKVKTERAKLTQITKDRRFSKNWSSSFSVELSPLPFKFEFFEGSVKLKLGSSFGPLKFDFQTGPKRNSYNSSAGLKWLIVRTPNMRAKVFHITGMNVELTLPSSIINISKETLTITCSKACLDDLLNST